MLSEFQISPKVETFQEDNRLPIKDLYVAYQLLISDFGWSASIVYSQKVETKDGSLERLPIIVLTSKPEGPALWILAGVHGEEPAGPNAIAKNIEYIGHLGKKIPIVLFPMCNPAGYTKDWRYPNERREWKKGRSVSDSEYLLPDTEDPLSPRVAKSAGFESEAITQEILSLINQFRPLLSIDHHEDEALEKSYIYSQGELGREEPAAQRIVEILEKENLIQLEGITRFGEEVHNGIIGPVPDGSVDELLSSKRIIVNGQLRKGPSTPAVIVIETPVIGVNLKKRVTAHEKIIHAYEEIFSLVNKK